MTHRANVSYKDLVAENKVTEFEKMYRRLRWNRVALVGFFLIAVSLLAWVWWG